MASEPYMFRLGVAFGRTLIRAGLLVSGAARRRALAKWASSESLFLEYQTRAHGELADGSRIEAWLHEDSDAATLEIETHGHLPTVVIRSRGGPVRSQKLQFEIYGLRHTTQSFVPRTSAGGRYLGRAEDAAVSRLDDLFEMLEVATAPPTALLAYQRSIIVEVDPPRSAAEWTTHVEILRATVARITPRARGPYG